MHIFLLLQANYFTYEVALFFGSHCIDTIIEDKKYSSRDLIPSIAMILYSNGYALSDIAAFGVNQGPGPFTSLRVIITTANGLAFATGIPLIGINSLEALLAENLSIEWPYTVALLNAFNNDLYFGIQLPEGVEIGCQNGIEFLVALKERFTNKKIRFLGNGVGLVKNEIAHIFCDNAYIQEPFIESCSLQQLAVMTTAAYEKKESFQTQLLPIYLKNMRYSIQI
jgi:tRNA threonylcarbamoyl adenosine modification protein YeaZ